MGTTNETTTIFYLHSMRGTWRDPYLHGVFTSREKAETYQTQIKDFISKYGTSSLTSNLWGHETWEISESKADKEFSVKNY